MANSYKPNYPSVGAWLRSSGELRGACQNRATAIVAVAKAIAPVQTGRYRASLHTEHARGWDGRVAVNVVAGVDYATVVEHRHHTLQIAAQSV